MELFAANERKLPLPHEGAEDRVAIQTGFALNCDLNVLAAKVDGKWTKI